MEAQAIVQALREDKKALKELAEEIVKVPDIRLAIVNAAMREMATKEDIKELRVEIDRVRAEIDKVRAEIKETEERIKNELKSYIDVRISDLDKRLEAQQRMMQIGFTVLGLLVVLAKFLS